MYRRVRSAVVAAFGAAVVIVAVVGIVIGLFVFVPAAWLSEKVWRAVQ